MFDRTPPKMSIVIPSWFGPGQDGKYGKCETFWFASECLDRLIQVTPKDSYELIIIDNGSSIDDQDILEAMREDTYPIHAEGIINGKLPSGYWKKADVLIRNPENLGFAPACNQGFALARGEYIVCLNNDILVWPGWEKAILDVFFEPLAPPPGVVMPALITETGDAREAIVLENIDLTKNAGAFGAGAEFGSLWVIKKSLLDEIKTRDGHVFDENFKLGMGEDRDLWDRVRLMGYETYRTHDTRVFHQGNMTIGKVPDRKSFTGPNREYLAQKRKERQSS